jgi:ABC-type sugar transport system permease subunit
MDQVVKFHLAAKNMMVSLESDNVQILSRFFANHIVLSGAATVSIIVTIARRDWRIVPLLGWFLTTLILLIIQVPLWSRHVIVLVPPMIAVVALGLNGFSTKPMSRWLTWEHRATFLMGILTWKYIGFAVILMLAGMQAIPDELSEAARIDGASYWQVQRHIVVPLLGPTIRIWGFLSIIGALQLFDLVYIIWGQYISSTAGTSTMATYMALNGRLAGNYGYGSAVAVVMFLISLTVALLYQRFVLRRDMRGAVTEGVN